MLPVYAYLSTSVFKSYLKLPKTFTTTADVTSSLFVILIILLLTVTIYYIIKDTSWHEIFNESSVVYAHPFTDSKNLQVVKIHNPFLLTLKDPLLCTLESVTCSITSKCPCFIRAFWLVDMRDLNTLLYGRDWSFFKTEMNNSDFCIGKKDAAKHIKVFPLLNEKLFTFKPCDKLDAAVLGGQPRRKYPLVICIMRDDEVTEPNAVVAMIVTIHIRDELCDLETVVLSHYLKQANSQVSKLQPLFIANSEQGTSESGYGKNPSSPPPCVVCLTNSITHALLPCRHMCVCKSCFTLIDKCPLCRGYIQSYFCDAPLEASDHVEENLELRESTDASNDSCNDSHQTDSG